MLCCQVFVLKFFFSFYPITNLLSIHFKFVRCMKVVFVIFIIPPHHRNLKLSFVWISSFAMRDLHGGEVVCMSKIQMYEHPNTFQCFHNSSTLRCRISGGHVYFFREIRRPPAPYLDPPPPPPFINLPKISKIMSKKNWHTVIFVYISVRLLNFLIIFFIQNTAMQ